MSEATPILMPQLGNTMEEGTIVKWLVKEGDAIKPGDVLYEVETDKATIEVESEVDGYLVKIVAPDGGTVPVKETVAYVAPTPLTTIPSQEPLPPVEPNGHSESSYPPEEEVAPGTSTPNPLPLGSPHEEGAPVKASPAARKAAEVLGVDLSLIPSGSGPGGRILREDVEALATQRKVAPKQSPAVPRAPEPAMAAPSRSGGSRRPMTKMRRAIARNLSLSKQTIPHWYTRVTVNAEPMLVYYRREKALYPCTLNDVIVEACARVIMEMPAFRSQVDGEEIVEFDHVHVGLAVGMDEGLVVPVIREVDGKNLKGIASESRRIVENARQGKIEGIGEGLFTISNLGMFGVEEFAAIINPPEVSILAVGAVREAVVVKDGSMKAGKVCTMTLSADHRMIDGVTSAKFVGRLKEVLEGL